MKNKVIEYVMNSPGNTNRAVLESLLEAIIGDGGSSDNVKTIIDVDLVLDEESGFMIYEDMAFNGIKLIKGEQYTVTLGEDVYTTKAWHGTEDGFEIFVLGNKQLFLEGAEDTGEPFAYIQECGDGKIGHCVIVTNGATHITITLVVPGGSSSDGGTPCGGAVAFIGGREYATIDMGEELSVVVLSDKPADFNSIVECRAFMSNPTGNFIDQFVKLQTEVENLEGITAVLIRLTEDGMPIVVATFPDELAMDFGLSASVVVMQIEKNLLEQLHKLGMEIWLCWV